MPRSGVPLLPPFKRTVDFGAEVRRMWGDEWMKKDVAYEFSNGRKFAASEPQGGPYTGTATGS